MTSPVGNPDLSAFFDAINGSSKQDPDTAMGLTLSLLAHEGEKSFVDLLTQLKLNPSQLLDLTAKMQSAGLITMPDQSGGQTFTLTPSGQALARSFQWPSS